MGELQFKSTTLDVNLAIQSIFKFELDQQH